MRHSRVLAACGAAALVAAAMAGTAGAGSASAKVVHTGTAQKYVVLADSASGADALADQLRSNGAKVTSVNKAIGMVVVTSDDANFRQHTDALKGVSGVAADRSIGHTPKDSADVEQEGLEAARAGTSGGAQAAAVPGPAGPTDPLDSNLWGMRMINADRAHASSLGNPKVRVGIMDTGVQADHPDLHRNFDYNVSRNFVTDDPAIDGPCEYARCVDPVGVDNDGHGTHVAGTIAAAMNGIGVSGVAPNATLVEVRAGQDSGFFFLSPTVNALTYSGDAGLDAVNMSFYVDPWLYNCVGGAPQDSAAEASEQNTIIEAMTRALNYAHGKGVTLVAAAGNNHEDMAKPRHDFSSPDTGATHERTIDNAKCFDLPVEGPHVLGITALGPSKSKADYSNYTSEPASGEVELSAPGGYFRDGFGTSTFRANGNQILSTYPLGPLRTSGEVDKNGRITKTGKAAGDIRVCQDNPAPGTSACGYYKYLQGTSMASPHATGVAALTIGEFGSGATADSFGYSPERVRTQMLTSAQDTACPNPPTVSYTNVGRSEEFTATCVGTQQLNGFYGEGIVNALGAVR